MSKRIAITLLFINLPFLLVAQLSKDSLLQEWQLSKNVNLTNYDTTRTKLLLNLAEVFIQNKTDSSILFSTKALEISTQNADSMHMLQSHKLLAKGYYIQSNSLKSYMHSLELIKLATELNDSVLIIYGLNIKGLVYILQNKLPEAIESLNQCIKLAYNINDSVSIAKGYLNKSIIYYDLHKYDSALNNVNKAIYISKIGTKDVKHLSMSYNRKGYILTKLKRYKEAIESHKKAINLMDKSNDWELCFSYSGLALAYDGLEDFENSIYFGKESLTLAKQIGANWDILNSAKIIANIYEKQHNYEDALAYYKIYQAYNDSIFSEKADRKISELKLIQSELEKKALENDNKINLAIIEARDIQLLLIGVVLFALLVLILVLIRSSRNRKLFTDKIHTQKDELSVLNKSKDKILSVLAHDMRSPINSILGLIYLMKKQAVKAEDLTKLYDDIYERTNTVSATLNNLLSWSMSQFKDIKINRTQVNIEEIITEQINLCNYDAQAKDITINHSKLSSSPLALVDIEHFRIVIRNLLANAIKFTKSAGMIDVSYKLSDNYIIISIKDSGIGMSSKVLSNLFTSLVETTPGTLSEIGTGLGLSLCNEYVKSNGGKIEVTSVENIGTTFSIYLKFISKKE